MIETQRKQVIFPPQPPPQPPPTNTIIDCFLFTECFSHVPTVQHQSEAKLLRLLHKNHDTLRLRQESTNLADTRKMNTGDWKQDVCGRGGVIKKEGEALYQEFVIRRRQGGKWDVEEEEEDRLFSLLWVGATDEIESVLNAFPFKVE